MWPANLAHVSALVRRPFVRQSKVNKKCLPLSPRTVICIRFLTAENWKIPSLVVHASLAMS